MEAATATATAAPATLERAVDALAQRTGGDGRGTGRDRHLIRRLAGVPQSTWGAAVERAAWEIACRERFKLLAEHGIDVDQLTEPPPADGDPKLRAVFARDGQVIVAFSFDSDLHQALLALPERHYDRDSKEWTLPATRETAEALVGLLTAHPGFIVDPDTGTLLRRLLAGEAVGQPARYAEPDGEHFWRLVLPAPTSARDWSLVAALKDIPGHRFYRAGRGQPAYWRIDTRQPGALDRLLLVIGEHPEIHLDDSARAALPNAHVTVPVDDADPLDVAAAAAQKRPESRWVKANAKTFTVDSGGDKSVTAAVAKLFGAQWDRKSKRYRVPRSPITAPGLAAVIDEHRLWTSPETRQALEQLASVERLRLTYAAKLPALSRAHEIPENIVAAALEGFGVTLHPFQRIPMVYPRLGVRNIWLADSMGLGKCLSAETKVLINGVYIRADEAWARYSAPDERFDGDGFWTKPTEPLRTTSVGADGQLVEASVRALYRQRVRERLRRVTLDDGSTVTITASHKLLGQDGWTTDLRVGDRVAVPKRMVSSHMDADGDLAELLGWQIAEGHELASEARITQQDELVLWRLRELAARVGRREGLRLNAMRISGPRPGRTASELKLSSAAYRDFLISRGYRWGQLSAEKQIPDFIVRADDAAACRFLRAFFDAEGSVNATMRLVEITSASRAVVDSLALMLRRFGIWLRIKPKRKSATNGLGIVRDYWAGYIGGESLRTFARKIGFGVDYKAIDLAQVCRRSVNGNVDGVPTRDLLDAVRAATYGLPCSMIGAEHVYFTGAQDASRNVALSVAQAGRAILDGNAEQEYRQRPKTKWTRPVLHAFAQVDRARLERAVDRIERRARMEVHWARIVSIEEVDYDGWVYDFEVPEHHNYVAGGLLSHNTVEALATVYGERAMPCVVVCPKSHTLNWARREIVTCISGARVVVLRGKKPDPAVLEDVDFAVIQHDLVIDWLDTLRGRFAGFIADESHNFANAGKLGRDGEIKGTKRTWAISELAADVRSRNGLVMLLTGTPKKNGKNIEMLSQLDILGEVERIGALLNNPPDRVAGPAQRFLWWFCLPAEAPVLMADMTERPISEVKPGDAVVGWAAGGEGGTRRLVETRVKNVHCRPGQPLQRVTMSDGSTLICTPDHRWFTGARPCEGEARMYQPARVGVPGGTGPHAASRIVKVTGDLRSPYAGTEDYDLGYLHGLFRGDGYASRTTKRTESLFKGTERTAIDAHRVGVGGCDVESIDRAEAILKRFGVTYARRVERGREAHHRTMHRIDLNHAEGFEFFAAEQPDTDAWWAGFLAGIYDAEGSESRIYQDAEHNPATSALIERALTRFEIPFRRSANGQHFRINGGRAGLLRFWALTNPALTRKLRSLVYRRGGQFMSDRPHVVEIEPLPGLHDVWTLTTETGNYVAYGFASKNCDPKPHDFAAGGYSYDGSSHDQVLHDLLRGTCYIRRHKQDVLDQLPPKTRPLVPLELTATQLGDYKRAQADIVSFLREHHGRRAELAALLKGLSRERARAIAAEVAERAGERAERAPGLVEMNTLRRLLAQAKLPAVIDWTRQFLTNDRKLVLFAVHKDIQTALVDAFPDAATIVHGDSVDTIEANKARFQADPGCQLIICSLGIAKEGHTLTAASDVAFCELDWAPLALEQAEDRCIAEGELVHTDRGLVPIETVVVGDRVLTHLGNWRPVAATSTKSATELVELRYARGASPLRCTPEHKVWTLRYGRPMWLEAGELRVGDCLALPRIAGSHVDTLEVPDECRVDTLHNESLSRCTDCGSTSISARGLCGRDYQRRKKAGTLPSTGRTRGRARALAKVIPLTAELLWLFGRYLADGSVSFDGDRPKQLRLAGHVDEVVDLEFAKDILQQSFDVPAHIDYKGGRSIELRASSGDLCRWFLRLFTPELPREPCGKGRFGAVKRLPPELLALDRKQAFALLWGYCSGDGYLDPHSGRVRWASVSPHLASQMSLLAAQCGYEPSIREFRTKSGTRAWEAHYNPASDPRQQDLRFSDHQYVWSPIRTIAHVSGEARVYDLSVEDDHSFVVGGAAVHNCYGRLNDLHGATCHYLLGVGPEQWDEFKTIDELMAARIDDKRRSNAATTDGGAAERLMGESILGEVLEAMTGDPR